MLPPATNDDLQRDGIARLGSLSPLEVFEVFSHLVDKALFLGGHVMRFACGSIVSTREFLSNPEAFYHYSLACYDFETIVTCRHIVPRALDFIDLAKEYLGVEPVMYSANIWWSFPGGEIRPDVQQWHRDPDDEKFLVVYYYLTDVADSEAHVYAGGSHRGPQKSTLFMSGRAGLIFIEDGAGLHKGMHPSTRPRLAAWVRFGVSTPPPIYYTDGLYPVAHPDLWQAMTNRERQVTRFIIKPDDNV